MTFSDISHNLAASIPTHHDLRAPMKADEVDAHPIKVKAARSRFILLEQLPKHDQITHLNWADIFSPETDEAFYSSMNAQIESIRCSFPGPDTIRAITAIFHISNTTYYQIFPPARHQLHPRSCSPPRLTRPGRPSLVPVDLEERLLQHIFECQDRSDCLSPRNAGSGYPNHSRAQLGW
jgi:hypothetical protein